MPGWPNMKYLSTCTILLFLGQFISGWFRPFIAPIYIYQFFCHEAEVLFYGIRRYREGYGRFLWACFHYILSYCVCCFYSRKYISPSNILLCINFSGKRRVLWVCTQSKIYNISDGLIMIMVIKVVWFFYLMIVYINYPHKCTK